MIKSYQPEIIKPILREYAQLFNLRAVNDFEGILNNTGGLGDSELTVLGDDEKKALHKDIELLETKRHI